MRRLTDRRWEELRWERVEDHYKFRLAASDETLASYELVSKKGVVAKASTESGSWLFTSRGHIHLEFLVREPHSRAIVARLVWHRRRGGTLEILHGRAFELIRGRGKVDPWRFVDDHDGEVVQVCAEWGKRYRLSVLSGGSVSVSPAGWNLGELELLLLTGWFALSWQPLLQEKTIRESPAP